ncbi:hypothetical protein COOONC_26523 [Cooperia oncophora]
MFGKDLLQTLQDKGIESMEDLNEYISVTERDGELLAVICDMFSDGIVDRTTLVPVLSRDPGFEETFPSRQRAYGVKAWTRADEDSATEKSDVTDWSSLRASLEAAFGDIGTTKRHISTEDRLLWTLYDMVPVYDASGNRMEFMGAVKIAVELEGGVYTIKGRSVDVSVVNDSDEPMICREGDVIGQWGTEKWREGWEDVNPLMLDSTSLI